MLEGRGHTVPLNNSVEVCVCSLITSTMTHAFGRGWRSHGDYAVLFSGDLITNAKFGRLDTAAEVYVLSYKGI